MENIKSEKDLEKIREGVRREDERVVGDLGANREAGARITEGEKSEAFKDRADKSYDSKTVQLYFSIVMEKIGGNSSGKLEVLKKMMDIDPYDFLKPFWYIIYGKAESNKKIVTDYIDELQNMEPDKIVEELIK